MLLGEKKKRYTIEDYMALREGGNYQLIENDLVLWNSPEPSSQVVHQIVSGRVFIDLVSFLNQSGNKGIIMYAPIDVRFDDGYTYQPDIVYVSEKRKKIIKSSEVNGAPDMIIEILSVSSAYVDLREKKDIYEKHGVKEYIIIDPIKENAELYAFENNVYQLKQKALKPQQLPSLIIPGFSFDLGRLFR